VVQALTLHAPPSFRLAVEAGAAAADLGQVFLAAYRAAVSTLVPEPGPGAVLATEDGPLRPGSVATTVVDGHVRGRKSFATGVPGADHLVVLASAGADGDRLQLVAVLVDARGPGVTITPMPPLPFAPEVLHATVAFSDAPVLRTLPGDGWADVVRPFRTVEDLHVCGAASAYLLTLAGASGFARRPVAALAGALSAAGALAAADPSDPAVHLALAGVLGSFEDAVDDLSWVGADPEVAARWARDAPLLRLAARARTARADTAARRLGLRPEANPGGT
jgi:acyl-CoA dehydrogenase